MYYSGMVDSRNKKPIRDLIATRWIQSFMQRSNNIESRAQCGKIMVSPAKPEQIEREMAFHLDHLAGEFCTNTL